MSISHRIRDLINNLGLEDSEEEFSSPSIKRGLKRSRRKKRFLNNPTAIDANEFPLHYIDKKMNDHIFLGATDFEDYIKSEVVKRRFDSRKKTIFREVNVVTNRKEWRRWSEKQFKDDLITEYNRVLRHF